MPIEELKQVTEPIRLMVYCNITYGHVVSSTELGMKATPRCTQTVTLHSMRARSRSSAVWRRQKVLAALANVLNRNVVSVLQHYLAPQ